MRRHALAILAVISLVGLGPLLFGHFADFNAFFVPKTGPRFVRVGTYECCLSVVWEYALPAAPGGPVQIQMVKVETRFQWRLPDRWHSLWDFHAGATFAPGFVITIPLWCLILPCTIAPILWLRRHRRRTARGFAIEPAAQPTIELPMK